MKAKCLHHVRDFSEREVNLFKPFLPGWFVQLSWTPFFFLVGSVRRNRLLDRKFACCRLSINIKKSVEVGVGAWVICIRVS